ncbi:ABC transporter permease [Leucobacter komagatae]|uniref:ABC transporter permease n=1 Tax=Leucobacter komagatae TaxID=55969 RepID=UPI000A06A93D|nr:ABC transporter permease [Leucobacter komagatae]
MRALIIKEFRELARDHRTLAMLVVLPILLLVIFGYAANFSVDRVTAIAVGPNAQELVDDLAGYEAAEDLDIEVVDTELGAADAEVLLRDREANAVILADYSDSGAPLSERMRVYLDGSSLFTTQTAQGMFVALAAEDMQQQFDDLGDRIAEAFATGSPPELTAPDLAPDEFVTVLFNPDLKTSWVMVPGLIGLILLFIGALITSIGLVRERETGTLEQLAVMPLPPSAIIFGKITPYFLLALIDMAVITALGWWLFSVPFAGSWLLFSLAGIVFLFVVLGIGVLISSVSHNTGQAIQLAILFVVPQVLLSGLIFPLDSMPIGVRWIGYILPLTWFREITQGVMVRGAEIDSLWFPLVILTIMAVLAFGAATWRMRRSLSHGGAR